MTQSHINFSHKTIDDNMLSVKSMDPEIKRFYILF